MGKMLLIVVLGASLIFSVMSLNMNRSNTSMFSNSVSEYENVHAKNNASAGIEIAIKNLSMDTSWTGTKTVQLHQGDVEITIQKTTSKYFNGPDEGLKRGRLITALGKSGSQEHVIRTVVELPSPNSSKGKLPPFMKYAMASDENISIQNVNIRDDNNSNWNSNVHTNKSFTMNGNNLIRGFLTYKGTASSNPGHRLNTQIVPNLNPDGSPNHYQSDEIEIPAFEPDDYIDIATEVHKGNLSVNGTTLLGTKDNPKIIYVGGNLNISGTFLGYGVYIVKGNVNVTANISILSEDPNSSSLGIYAKGNVECGNNTTIKAQLFSYGKISFSSNSRLYGSMTAKGIFEFKGRTEIYYKPASDVLTAQIWKVDGVGPASERPVILSYYE